MQCEKVREKLVKYLAGECQPFEEKAIKWHLNRCHDCTAQKITFERLDSLLDSWEDEKAPPGLAKQVMMAVYQEELPRRKKAALPALVRDLVAAAAVTLFIFWTGGGWLSPNKIDQVGQNLGNFSRTYSRATVATVDKAFSLADEWTVNIIDKEWVWE